MYLDYEHLKDRLDAFKAGIKSKEHMKLIGYYTLTNHKAMISLDIFKMQKPDLVSQSSLGPLSPSKEDTAADEEEIHKT